MSFYNAQVISGYCLGVGGPASSNTFSTGTMATTLSYFTHPRSNIILGPNSDHAFIIKDASLPRTIFFWLYASTFPNANILNVSNVSVVRNGAYLSTPANIWPGNSSRPAVQLSGALATPVPAPLPAFGLLTALAYSRRLRRKQARDGQRSEG